MDRNVGQCENMMRKELKSSYSGMSCLWKIAEISRLQKLRNKVIKQALGLCPTICYLHKGREDDFLYRRFCVQVRMVREGASGWGSNNEFLIMASTFAYSYK